VVESVKAASDVYAPVAGEVTAGNSRLAKEPEVINTDAYGAGWLWRLRPQGAPAQLLSAAEYEKLLAAEGG
jgi:glycine cleavage system H protein